MDEHGGLSENCTCPPTETTDDACEKRGIDPLSTARPIADETHVKTGKFGAGHDSLDGAKTVKTSNDKGTDVTDALLVLHDIPNHRSEFIIPERGRCKNPVVEAKKAADTLATVVNSTRLFE